MSARPCRILLIDDDPRSRVDSKTHLEKQGYVVITETRCGSGILRILVAHLARDPLPDAVILSGDLGAENGVACLRMIRSDPRTARVPVIMVTAMPVRDMVVRIAKIGLQALLTKRDNLGPEIVKRLESVGVRGSVSQGEGETGTQPHPKELAEPAERTSTPRSISRPPKDPASHAVVNDADEAESLRVSLLQLDGTPDMERAIVELKKLKPLMPRAHLLDRIVGEVELKAARPAVQQVLHLTTADRASLDTIARAIKQDQALSLKVLKLANSAVYGRPDRVDTVQKAVARIGLSQVRSTVLGLTVMEQFGGVVLAEHIRADWFWEHSIATGLFAARIARLRKASAETIDAMFIAGLLHDVGRLIFAEKLGETYSGVLDVANQLELPLEVVESRLLLVNHADLTDRLLREWRFPPDLIHPIAMHHLSVGNARHIAPRHAEAIANLGLANALAHSLSLGSSGNDCIYPLEEYLDFLAIEDTDLERMCQEVPDETVDLKLMMLSHASAESTGVIEHLRDEIGGDVRPLVIAEQPQRDPIAILLARVVEPTAGGAGPPNLAILRITRPQDRSVLIERLRAAESSRGVGSLPVVVVANARSGFVTEGWLRDRTVAQVTVPIRTSRLVRLARETVQGESQRQPTR